MAMMEQAPGYNMYQYDACNNASTTNIFLVLGGPRRRPHRYHLLASHEKPAGKDEAVIGHQYQ